jgi:hypothetical protein
VRETKMEIELVNESKVMLDVLNKANEMAIGVDIKVKVTAANSIDPRDCLFDVMKFVENLEIIDDYDDYYFSITYMNSDEESDNKVSLYYVIKIIEILN